MELTISVAMCTYNGSRFLPDQLESIASQHRLPDELVVCDDNSSDDSLRLLERFSRSANFPVRVIQNDETLGSSRNFEQAVSLCRGAIIALADQDDIWYAHKLQILEQSFLGPTEIVAAFSDAVVVDEECRPLHQRLWSSVRFYSNEQQKFQLGSGWTVLLRHPVVTGATLAFRSGVRNSLFPIPEDIVHDRWISFLLAVMGRMALVKDPLLRYRNHRMQQIGLGPQGLAERFHHSHRRGGAFYGREIEFLRKLSQRLECLRGAPTTVDDAISEIQRKILHLESRVHLRQRNVARVSKVFREVCNGGYWKYSAGWESVAKDLFLAGH